MAKKKLDPDKAHWTEVEAISAGLGGVRSFRPMTDEEIDRFNKSKTGKVKVQPADVKLPDPLT